MRFAEVIGHSALKKRLLGNLSEGRISHAQLFLGPEGSGAFPLARAVAQYILCQNPGATDSCGECASCIKSSKLVHPDISFSFPIIKPEKIEKPTCNDFIVQFRDATLGHPYMNHQDWMNFLGAEKKQGIIPVHEARAIINRLSLKSVEGDYRIILMWLPEKMKIETANALLKILEEPQERTVFLLVAEQDENIPLTVLSRTQLVKVQKLPDEEIINALSEKSENGSNIKSIAHRADGNFRVALQLLSNDDPDEDLSQTFLEWMRACLKLNIVRLQELTEQLSGIGRERQKTFFEFSLSIVRECLVMNYGDESLLKIQGKELESFTKLAPFINAGNAEEFIKLLDDAHYHVERNANFKILFMDLSFKIFRALNKK
ncbi:MAG: ATP-binding protein [Bacteroidota bacterium]